MAPSPAAADRPATTLHLGQAGVELPASVWWGLEQAEEACISLEMADPLREEIGPRALPRFGIVRAHTMGHSLSGLLRVLDQSREAGSPLSEKRQSYTWRNVFLAFQGESAA